MGLNQFVTPVDWTNSVASNGGVFVRRTSKFLRRLIAISAIVI